jgi:hypothetical protein
MPPAAYFLLGQKVGQKSPGEFKLANEYKQREN